MGNNPSQLAIGEASATQAKKGIDVLVSDYVEFLESTSALIDENIEDLGNEIAMATAQFRVSDEFKALSAEQQRILQEDVEKHANLHKHAVRRVFAILSDAYDTFEDMSYAITQPEDAEDLEDNDDYEEDDEEDEEDDEEDGNDAESEDEQDFDDEDDVEDEDYNTEAAENDLAAELDSEEDEDEDEDDEDELDYENFEEIVTDEEVLYTARIACKHYLEQFTTEMNDLGLPEDILEARLALLRRLLYRAAENIVSDAVDFFVDSYRNAALEDIDNLLCLGMTSGSLSSEDPDDVRAALRNIITVNAVSRQALDDLPFTQRESIMAAQEEIAEAVLDVIRRIQLQNIDKPRVLEMLMDLDIDDFGEDEEDYEVDEDFQVIDDDEEEEEEEDEDEEEEEDDEDEEEEEEVEPPKAAPSSKKAAPTPRKPAPKASKQSKKPVSPKPVPAPKETAPTPSSAKKGRPSRQQVLQNAEIEAAAAAAAVSGTKRKGEATTTSRSTKRRG